MYEVIVSKIKSVYEMRENKNSKFLGMEFEEYDDDVSLLQIECMESLLVNPLSNGQGLTTIFIFNRKPIYILKKKSGMLQII